MYNIGKKFIFWIFITSIIPSCALKNQLDHRKLLKKTQIDFVSTTPELNFFNNSVIFDGKKFSINQIKPIDLQFIDNFKKGKFELKIDSVKFNNVFKITNPNSQKVILDKFSLDMFFDDKKVASIEQTKTIIVEAKNSLLFNVTATIHKDIGFDTLLKVEKIKLKAKISLAIDVFGVYFYRNALFDKSISVPRKQIMQQFNQNKTAIVEKIIETIKSKSNQFSGF